MIEISFNFKGAFTKIQCNTDDKIIDICKKFAFKINQNINDIYFLYDGRKVNLSEEKLRIGELQNNIDKSNKKMAMIVYENDYMEVNDNHKIKSKEIICPNCFGNSIIKIEDYKIKLLECEERHISDDIFFKDFQKTQYIDISKIICDICKKNNKAKTYENKFFKCNTCKLNLCPLCKKSHYNDHYIVDYDDKNYYCDIHDERYSSYCKDCNKNICLECEKNHKNHKILSYSDLFPEENKKKTELNEFRSLLNKVKNEINEIKNICDKFSENVESYYTIYSDIINNYNYNNKNRNYQILKNINDIKDKIIINDIKEISSENDKSLKFKKIYEIFNKMIAKKAKNGTEATNNHKTIDNKKINKINKANDKNKNINKNNKNDEYNINANKTYNRFYFQNLDLSKEIKKNSNQNNNKKNIKVNNSKDMKRKIYKDTIKKNDNINDRTTNNFLTRKESKNNNSKFQNKNIKKTNKTPLNLKKSVPIFKPIKDANEISIIYKIDQNDKKKGEVKIFGYEFVMKNEKKCYIIHNNIKYDLTDNFNIKDIKENTFEIKLIDIKNINNMSFMFNGCSSLISIKDISNWKTSNIEDMSYLFYGCSSLSNFSGISEWDTKNVTNMSNLFSFCKHLVKLPDISKWDTSKVKDMNNIFNGCSSLKEIPDISKWNTSDVKDMRGIFNNCSSLEKLPDISKWNTCNAISMSNLFNGCSSLKVIPDISKWNTDNVTTMDKIFSGCNSLSSLPKISTFSVKNKENIFSGCPERLIPKK